MQYIKRVFAIMFIVVMLFAITAPCFAAAAALTAAEQMVALWSLYTEAVGMDTVYTTNGFKSSFSNPFSRSSAASNISDLYNQYCTFSGRVETLSDTVAWIKANTQTAISVQQKGAFEYSAGVTEFFDKFTTWVLEEVVGIQKNLEGAFSTSNPWFNNELYYNTTAANLIACPIVSSSPSYTDIAVNGIHCGNNNFNYAYYAACGASAVYLALICQNLPSSSVSQTYHFPIWISESPFTAYYATQNGYGSQTVSAVASSNTSSWFDTNGYYIAVNASYQVMNNSIPSYIPLYTNQADVVSALSGGITSDTQERIQLGPKDIYNDGVLGIPDVDAQDYTAKPLTGELDDAAVDSIDDAIPDILDRVLANADALTDTLAQGITAVAPFLPFGSIPSFSFGFSGIWHYVVEWIGSLGSGLDFFTSIWSNIPPAMIIPIYASAVIVIVTAVFKRFV